MKIINFIIPYLKKYNIKFIIFILLTFILSIIALLIPYFSGKYIDLLLTSLDMEFVILFALIIGCMNILNIVIQYISDLLHTKVNTNIAFDISTSLYEHIKRLPLSYFQSVDSVYLSNRIIEDSNNIVSFFTTNIISIIIEAIKLLASVAVLYTIDKTMAFTSVVVIPIYILLYNLFKKPIYNSTKEFREKQNMFFSKVAEQFFNIKFIKINNLYKDMKERLKASYSSLFSILVHYYRVNFMFNNLGTFFTVITSLFFMIYGGYLVINKRITIGNYTILNTYMGLIISSIMYFLNLGKSYQSTLFAYDRIIELQEIEEELIGDTKIGSINEIIIKNLTLIIENELKLFDKFSYMFEKGNIYIIKGNNGSGKTTLANTLIGLNDCLYDGDIFINEQNIKNIDMEDLRRTEIAFFIQEQSLISSDLMDNITIGIDKKIKKEEIDYWLDKLYISEKIENLKEGLLTKISEGNTNLSGGEKQKLSLIRLLLKNYSLLILDEPTSALDENSIISLKEILDDIKHNSIVIIITHDNKLLNIADEVIVLDS